MEILTTFLELRARNLRYALRRMLMDETEVTWLDPTVGKNNVIRGVKKVLNLFLRVLSKFTNTFLKISGLSSNFLDIGLFHTFYNQPSIKYLGAGGFANKPSYIAPHNFSKTIIDTIQSNLSIEGILKKIKSDLDVLAAAYETLDSTLKTNFNGEYGKTDEQDFKEWFDGKQDKDKIKIAADILPVNHSLRRHLQSLKNMANDNSDQLNFLLKELLEGESLLEKIKVGIAVLPEGSDTRKQLESLLANAHNDLQKFKLLLEEWFNDTMERAAGWFKRRIQYFLFFTGFFLAVSFNANTIDIVKKLSNDPKAREQLVALAIEYSTENNIKANKDEKLRKNLDPANPDNKKEIDSLKESEDELREKTHDSLQKVVDSIQADIYKAQNIISTNWHIPDSIEIKKVAHCDPSLEPKKEKDLITYTFNATIKEEDRCKKGYFTRCISVKVHKSIDIGTFKETISPIPQKEFEKGTVKVKTGKYKWKHVFSSFKNFWGYFLTALAISLGSPFWFDLLNKLIRVRNSIKPKEQDISKRNPNPNTNTMHDSGVSLKDRVG